MGQSIKDKLLCDEKYEYKVKICGTKYIGLDWGNHAIIDDAIAIDKDNKDEVENTRKKSRQLRKDKQRLKLIAEREIVE